MNEPVLSVGCGVGAPPVCHIERVTGLDPRGDIETTGGDINGRSGGALFNQRGQLMGILSRGGNDVTVFVHYAKIHDFLSGAAQWIQNRGL